MAYRPQTAHACPPSPRAALPPSRRGAGGRLFLAVAGGPRRARRLRGGCVVDPRLGRSRTVDRVLERHHDRRERTDRHRQGEVVRRVAAGVPRSGRPARRGRGARRRPAPCRPGCCPGGRRSRDSSAQVPTGGPTATPTPTPTPTVTATPTPTPTPTGSAGTVNVSTTAQLIAAFRDAVPGRTINVAPGDYVTSNSCTVPGGAAAAHLCGSAVGTATAPVTVNAAGARLVGQGPSCRYGLYLYGASYWHITGLAVTEASKGIVLDLSTHITLDSVDVGRVGRRGSPLPALLRRRGPAQLAHPRHRAERSRSTAKASTSGPRTRTGARTPAPTAATTRSGS